MRMGYFGAIYLLGTAGVVIATPAADQATDPGILVIGQLSGGACSQALSGFGSGVYGKYFPSELTGGTAVVAVFDSVFLGSCNRFSALSVSGFPSNPGASWLSAVTCNGVRKSGGDAIFSYSGGVAEWMFVTLFGFDSMRKETKVSCVVVHDRSV